MPTGSKCSVSKSQGKPLIVEWSSPDRGDLEALAARHTVAVRYEGCEMEILGRCAAPGRYRYAPVSLKSDRVHVRDSDDLYANLPIGAAKLEAQLQKAGELNVDMTIVGRYESDGNVGSPADLRGDCAKATHVVTAASVGAFVFFAGTDASLGGGIGVGGAGVGGGERHEQGVLSRDGDVAACGAATMSDARPPDKCRSMLRVEVSPLPWATAAERALCPEGTAFDGKECASTGGGQRTAGWVVGGIGVAGLALGGALFAYGQAGRSGCPSGSCTGTAKDNYDTASTVLNVSTGAFIAGGVGVATGAILLLTAPKARARSATGTSPNTTLAVGPTGLMLEGSF
jgi:hypothetical protein